MTSIPGVESAALATRVPLQVNPNRWELWMPDRHQPGEHGDTIDVTTVSTSYFHTLGVPIVEGRAFTDADGPNTRRVAVVNETFANRYWPRQSAIGKIFRTRGSEGPLSRSLAFGGPQRCSQRAAAPFCRPAQPAAPLVRRLISRTRGDPARGCAHARELLALDRTLSSSRPDGGEVDSTLSRCVPRMLVSGLGGGDGAGRDRLYG